MGIVFRLFIYTRRLIIQHICLLVAVVWMCAFGHQPPGGQVYSSSYIFCSLKAFVAPYYGSIQTNWRRIICVCSCRSFEFRFIQCDMSEDRAYIHTNNNVLLCIQTNIFSCTESNSRPNRNDAVSEAIHTQIVYSYISPFVQNCANAMNSHNMK